jgi:hypothetical protein
VAGMAGVSSHHSWDHIGATLIHRLDSDQKRTGYLVSTRYHSLDKLRYELSLRFPHERDALASSANLRGPSASTTNSHQLVPTTYHRISSSVLFTDTHFSKTWLFEKLVRPEHDIA